MLIGIYKQKGSIARLRNKKALLQQDPNKQNNFLAQFDKRHLPEAFGWHSFPKKLFVKLKSLSIEVVFTPSELEK